MPCCSAGRRLAAWLLTLAAWLLLAGTPTLALAGQIEPKEAALQLAEENYALVADFAIELGPRFEEAVTRGVALHFNLEVVIERPRQLWVAEHVVTRQQSYKLSYSSLTRQFRLSSGGLHQSFDSLSDALRILGRVVSLPVVEKNQLKAGESYQVALRLSLDRNQLPKPFQVDAITDKDWRIDAKTLRWTFKP